MKFELNSGTMLFAKTEVPDVFIQEYLPDMPGDVLKVYIFLLFFQKYTQNIDLRTISTSINIDINSVSKSLEYLEDKRLIIKINGCYKITSVQEEVLNNQYNRKRKMSSKELNKKIEQEREGEIITTINNQFFAGEMSTIWYMEICNYIDKYHFTNETLLALFAQCKSYVNKLTVDYVGAVALSWYNQGIITIEDVKKKAVESEKLNSESKRISKKLGLSRNLTEFERKIIEKWLFEYSYNKEIIDEALSLTISKRDPNFKYLDAIISSWYNEKLKNLKEIKEYINKRKKENEEKFAKTGIKKGNSSSKKITYAQRDYDNYDIFYDI